MLTIDWQLFLTEANLDEKHVIQSWLGIFAKYASTNIFTIQNCIFEHDVSLFDCWNTLLHEILKAVEYLGGKIMLVHRS